MKNKAIALGTFDGLHTGHKQILSAMKAVALERGLEPLIYTFTNHPMEVFGKAPRRIMEDERRIERLNGHAPVIAEVFDMALAATPPEEFAERMTERGMAVAIAGFNYTFGQYGRGTMDSLREYGKKYGFDVIEVSPHIYKGGPVSSTRIRGCIEKGEIADANAMLGWEYSLHGPVIRNKGIGGGRIGCPTANIPEDSRLVQPAAGVYATRAVIGGETYGAVTNIGSNPTVHGDKTTIETHLLGFDGDIYGRELRIHFIERLRGEIVFPDIAALAAQIERDKQKTLEILTK